MAFDRTKLGGNLVASALQSTMFIYTSDVDDLATIAGNDYFAGVNGKTPIQPVGSARGAEQILFKDDIMLITGTDGLAIASVNSGAQDVTLESTEV